MNWSRYDTFIVATLFAVLAAQSAWFVATTSGVYDETVYLEVGRVVYHDGDFRRFSELGLAPLPILLNYALPSILQTSGYRSAVSLARASSVVLVGFPLLLISYTWIAREAGRRGGFAGAAALSLSPNIVAHTSLATTDACFLVAALIALASLTAHIRRRSWHTLIFLAIGLGVALSAKYSAVALFPVVAIMLLLSSDRKSQGFRRSLATAAKACAVTGFLFVAALALAWALHAFTVVEVNVGIVGRVLDVPAPLAGLLEQFRHNRSGHLAFLFGDVRLRGWWYYMPLALLVKSTPAELLIMAASVYAFLIMARSGSTSALVWCVAFVVYLGFSMSSNLNLGIRYVLLVPCLAVLATTTWFFKVSEHRKPAIAVAAGVLVLQLASVISISPHYLGYFNGLAGGPAEGYRYLADSNLDWGQDLPALREAIQRVGAKHPIVSYFGTAPLDAYGIAAVQWPGTEDDRNVADWIAISANHLNGLYVLPPDTFDEFRRIPPSYRAGYSIFLYKTDRADVQRAMAAWTRAASAAAPP